MPPHTQALTPGLVRLMAIATGLAVACNYYAQPLLPAIADDLHLDSGAAGAIVTTAQLGYALGLLLIVPLGDLVDRRRLIVAMSLLAAGGLLINGLAPGLTMLLVGTAIAGLCSVVAQILVPLAAALAEPTQRGKIVGTVMSGLLLGILLARTIAGLLTGLGDWRTVYFAGALAMLAIAIVLARRLPGGSGSVDLPYPRLLLSVLQLFLEEAVLRRRAVLGALSFANFSVLWTSMAFFLSAPPFGYAPATIGLFGLAGAAGALAAPLAGRLADSGRGEIATLLALGMLLLSWVPLGLAAEHGLMSLMVGILLLDWAVQGVHVSNQGAIYRIRPDARNRLTAAYMTSYFIGGALGSLASAQAYGIAGWSGVVTVGVVLSAAGIVAWLGLHRPAA